VRGGGWVVFGGAGLRGGGCVEMGEGGGDFCWCGISGCWGRVFG